MKLNKIIISLLAILLFGACEVEIEEATENSTYITGTIDAGNLNTSDFKVMSIFEEVEVGNNKFTIQTFECDLPQMLMVKNNKDEVVMLYRDLTNSNNEITINAYSTAITLLTFHPVLGAIHGDDYRELINLISTRKSFDTYLSAVEKSISQNRFIYDTTNTELLDAAKNLFADLISDSIKFDKKFGINLKSNSPLTDLYDCAPIDVTAEGNTLKFKIPGLTPTYECKVYDEYGGYEGYFFVPTRGNYGVWDATLCVLGQGDWLWGEEASFTFNDYSKKTFVFNRSGIETFSQLALCILQALGVPEEWVPIRKVATSIMTALAQNGISLATPGGNFQTLFYSALPIALDATLEVVEEIPFFTPKRYLNLSYFAKRALFWVNIVEGSGNLTGRIYSYLNSRDEITFCSQRFSNNKFGICTDATLRKKDGDNQTAFPGDLLPKPIVVELITENDISDRNYIVKFVTNNGHGWYDEIEVPIINNTASYQWRLNENDETQYAWAQLIDKDNNLILDSVKFTANVKHERWYAGERCEGRDSYLFTFALDLGTGGDYQIPATTISVNDYDGDPGTKVYSGSFVNNVLNLTVITYYDGYCRTDVFNGQVTGNSITINGVLTGDNDGCAGCNVVLDMEKVDSNTKRSDILSKKVNDNNSKANGCTESMH